MPPPTPLTVDWLKDQRLDAELGTYFKNEDTVDALYDDLDWPRQKRRIFYKSTNPQLFWRDVLAESGGGLCRFGLEALVAAALSHYPRNPVFLRCMGWEMPEDGVRVYVDTALDPLVLLDTFQYLHGRAGMRGKVWTGRECRPGLYVAVFDRADPSDVRDRVLKLLRGQFKPRPDFSYKLPVISIGEPWRHADDPDPDPEPVRVVVPALPERGRVLALGPGAATGYALRCTLNSLLTDRGFVLLLRAQVGPGGGRTGEVVLAPVGEAPAQLIVRASATGFETETRAAQDVEVGPGGTGVAYFSYRVAAAADRKLLVSVEHDGRLLGEVSCDLPPMQ